MDKYSLCSDWSTNYLFPSLPLLKLPYSLKENSIEIMPTNNRTWTVNFHMFKLVLEKAEEPEINIHWIIEKASEFQKNFYFCFIDYAKAFVWITTNCGKVLKRWEYHTTWPASWDLNAGQEATVRTRHGTMEWFQCGKGVCQGCILSLCLFNLYAEYIMRYAGLDEAQAAIEIAGRNINNLRYGDDTTLMAESEEELKTFLMKVQGEWKTWLKTQ